MASSYLDYQINQKQRRTRSRICHGRGVEVGFIVILPEGGAGSSMCDSLGNAEMIFASNQEETMRLPFEASYALWDSLQEADWEMGGEV